MSECPYCYHGMVQIQVQVVVVREDYNERGELVQWMDLEPDTDVGPCSECGGSGYLHRWWEVPA